MIILKSSRLEVKIAQPNEEYNTCRFNRAGFIMSAVLDGETEFLGDEKGGSEGYGLCSEIKLDPLSENVLPGEKFVKFGVGIMTKPDEKPYNFMNRYETEPFEIETSVSENQAVFITKSKAIAGYAMAEKKTVTVKENMIRVEYELLNEGEKELNYREYVHNFLTHDFAGERNQYNLFIPNRDPGEPFTWTISFYPTGRKITGKDYFVPESYNIWSPGFVISPEIFIDEKILPGKTLTYAREWIFE